MVRVSTVPIGNAPRRARMPLVALCAYFGYNPFCIAISFVWRFYSCIVLSLHIHLYLYVAQYVAQYVACGVIYIVDGNEKNL